MAGPCDGRWVLPSELVPLASRAKVVALGTVLNWLVDFAVVSSYLSLGRAAFPFYLAVNLAALAFVALCVPETKGLALEDSRRQALATAAAPGSLRAPAPLAQQPEQRFEPLLPRATRDSRRTEDPHA